MKRSMLVYDYLKKNICNIKLKPDDPLIESKIAEKLTVSRTPVREALNKLEKENLVKFISGKGAFVTSINPEDIENIFVVREALEGIAAREAANKTPDHVVNDLGKLFAEEEAKWNKKDRGMLVDDIHNVVLKFGGNKLIGKILNNLNGQLIRFYNYSLIIPGRDSLSFQEHKKIFEAVKSKNSQLAEIAMREHLRSTKESLLNIKIPT